MYNLPEDVLSQIQFDPIMIGYRGSHSHGTYVPSTDPNSTDDIDLMVISIPPPDYHVGLKTWKREAKDYWVGEYDIVEYSLKKFVFLLSKCNPNVTGMLWLRHEDYFLAKKPFYILRENRNIFLSKRLMKRGVLGHANNQIKRMTTFDKAYQGHMGQKRKALVAKYGFDTRAASHALRLLLMYKDFLYNGELNVFREYDADLLIEVKSGKWPLLAVLDMISIVMKDCEDEDLYESCPAPKENDQDKINDILTNIMMQHYLEQERMRT